MLFELLKDFEVCPGMVSKAQAFRSFKKATEQPVSTYTPTGLDILVKLSSNDVQVEKLGRTIGKEFTFFKFLDFLVQIAEAAYTDPNKLLAEKVCFLLEVMELSRGYRRIEMKSSRTHSAKVTLLPSRKVIGQIQFAKDQVFVTHSASVLELTYKHF